MDTMTSPPPLLPEPQWSGSYVSYWEPMRPGDQITSGMVWFDYARRVFRIDGLFNPWDEEATGCRLWMSELNFFGEGKSYKTTVTYAITPGRYDGGSVQVREDESRGCLVPADVLRANSAVRVGEATVLGEAAEGWRYARPEGRGPVTYWLKRGGGPLLRMVTGDPAVHASVRDFPSIDERPIPESIFSRPTVNGPAAPGVPLRL